MLSLQQLLRKALGHFLERLNWESWAGNVAIVRQAASGGDDVVRLYMHSTAGADLSKLFFTVPRAAPMRGSLTEQLAIATGGAGGGDPLLQRQRLRFIFADAEEASAFFALLSDGDDTAGAGDKYALARDGALTAYRNVSAGGLHERPGIRMAALSAIIKRELQASGLFGSIAGKASAAQPTWTRLTTTISKALRPSLEAAFAALKPDESDVSRTARAKAVANFFAAFASRAGWVQYDRTTLQRALNMDKKRATDAEAKGKGGFRLSLSRGAGSGGGAGAAGAEPMAADGCDDDDESDDD